MTIEHSSLAARSCILCLAILLPGCSVLNQKPPPPLQTYAWDSVPGAKIQRVALPVSDAVPSTAAGQHVILVSMPTAAPGYDSSRMVYMRDPGVLEAFTQSVWVDTPARMLAPMLAHALQESGAYRAVVLAASSARADLRLDSSIVRLQQSYLQQPSQTQLTLRVTLLDNNSRDVLDWHEFNITQSASSEDAPGAAAATRAVVQQAMQELVVWLSAH